MELDLAKIEELTEEEVVSYIKFFEWRKENGESLNNIEEEILKKLYTVKKYNELVKEKDKELKARVNLNNIKNMEEYVETFIPSEGIDDLNNLISSRPISEARPGFYEVYFRMFDQYVGHIDPLTDAEINERFYVEFDPKHPYYVTEIITGMKIPTDYDLIDDIMNDEKTDYDDEDEDDFDDDIDNIDDKDYDDDEDEMDEDSYITDKKLYQTIRGIVNDLLNENNNSNKGTSPEEKGTSTKAETEVVDENIPEEEVCNDAEKLDKEAAKMYEKELEAFKKKYYDFDLSLLIAPLNAAMSLDRDSYILSTPVEGISSKSLKKYIINNPKEEMEAKLRLLYKRGLALKCEYIMRFEDSKVLETESSFVEKAKKLRFNEK